MDQPIRGILFDKDGTLFDFHRSWSGMTEAMLDLLAPDPVSRGEMALAAGYDPEARRFVAGSVIVAEPSNVLAELWSRWRPDLGAERIERMANRAAAEAVGADGALATAVADLPGFLAGLSGRGLALGVATHDEEASTRVQLRTIGVLDCFDFIAGYDSGHGVKPGPGMLDAFARHIGAPTAAIIGIGDSRHDLEMVRAGGGRLAIGVLTGPAVIADLAPHADHVLGSIADLPALLDRLGAGDRPNPTGF